MNLFVFLPTNGLSPEFSLKNKLFYQCFVQISFNTNLISHFSIYLLKNIKKNLCIIFYETWQIVLLLLFFFIIVLFESKYVSHCHPDMHVVYGYFRVRDSFFLVCQLLVLLDNLNGLRDVIITLTLANCPDGQCRIIIIVPILIIYIFLVKPCALLNVIHAKGSRFLTVVLVSFLKKNLWSIYESAVLGSCGFIVLD